MLEQIERSAHTSLLASAILREAVGEAVQEDLDRSRPALDAWLVSEPVAPGVEDERLKLLGLR